MQNAAGITLPVPPLPLFFDLMYCTGEKKKRSTCKSYRFLFLNNEQEFRLAVGANYLHRCCRNHRGSDFVPVGENLRNYHRIPCIYNLYEIHASTVFGNQVVCNPGDKTDLINGKLSGTGIIKRKKEQGNQSMILLRKSHKWGVYTRCFHPGFIISWCL